MPTLLRIGAYRFFFYSLDRGEPPHVHVAHDGKTAKYWLDPVELARSEGFRAHELRQLRAMVDQNASLLRERWNGYFGT